MFLVARLRPAANENCVWQAGAQHAETPLWDARTQSVLFIDGHRGELLSVQPSPIGSDRTQPASASRRRRLRAAAELGFARASDEPNRLLCGVGTAIVEVDFDALDARADALHSATSHRVLARAPDDERLARFNDAGVDAAGRLWTGTMARDGASPLGVLYRLEAGELVAIADGFAIPNGFAFDRAGTTLYVADSALRVIHAFELDARARLRMRRVLYRGAQHGDVGFPDGMAVDREDHLWVAFYEGSCLKRLRPDGSIAREVPLRTRRVTACAFGGPELRTLYFTADGGLWAIPVDVPGLPVHPVRHDLAQARGPSPD